MSILPRMKEVNQHSKFSCHCQQYKDSKHVLRNFDSNFFVHFVRHCFLLSHMNSSCSDIWHTLREHNVPYCTSCWIFYCDLSAEHRAKPSNSFYTACFFESLWQFCTPINWADYINLLTENIEHLPMNWIAFGKKHAKFWVQWSVIGICIYFILVSFSNLLGKSGVTFKIYCNRNKIIFISTDHKTIFSNGYSGSRFIITDMRKFLEFQHPHLKILQEFPAASSRSLKLICCVNHDQHTKAQAGKLQMTAMRTNESNECEEFQSRNPSVPKLQFVAIHL